MVQRQERCNPKIKYGYATAFQTPSGETRYQGGGFDPETGEARSQLTLDDKRQLEMFAEKGKMPNKAKLVDFLSASGDEAQFEERLKYAQLLYPGIFKGGQ